MKTMRLQIEDEALQDLQSADRWYEKERPGLGFDFLFAIEAAFSAIRRNPDAFAMVGNSIRRAPVRRFPYGVFFLVEDDSIVVIAVLHAKRSPKLWLKRARRRK